MSSIGADERARDDAPDGVLADADLGACDRADAVELLDRDDVLVRRDLEHRVRARVHDRLACGDVLVAELLDDDRPRRCEVAQPAVAGLARERVHDLDRKAIRIDGERVRQSHPHHLPVARGGVLAGRGLQVPAPRRRRTIGRGDAEDVCDVAQSEGAEIGHVETAICIGGVGQRVGALVTIGRCVRQGAGAHRVEHQDDRPRPACHP
jgi:hypothetical protein